MGEEIMFRRAAFIFLILGFALGACSHGVVAQKHYRAVIDDFDSMEGAYFTTKEGSAPMWYLHLRLQDSASHSATEILKIQVLATYEPKKFGEVGDLVSFTIPGHQNPSGTLLFEDLSAYKIESKAKKAHPVSHSERP